MDWHPIEHAPLDRYILVTDGSVLPDVVCWRPEVPERLAHGCRYLAVPEGWFNAELTRSRVQPTHWADLPAFRGGATYGARRAPTGAA